MQISWLIVGVLAVWRIAHLLQAEDGPWQVIVRLRRLAGSSVVGQLLDCFYCLSLWVALPVAVRLGDTWGDGLLLWPALSGGAVLLQRATQPDTSRPAFYEELPGPGGQDVVLRSSQTDGSRPAAAP